MATPAETKRLEQDFLSGRDPRAYIPLCAALRRQKSYIRGLEMAQRGLRGDPTSVAGRIIYARLLSDVGHYEDALREIARLEILNQNPTGFRTGLHRRPEQSPLLRLL
mgnify:CR=1 FL=1